MAIRSFKSEEVELFFVKKKIPRKKSWAQLSQIVQRKLDMLHYAKDLKDLFSPPSNRLESLSGDLNGSYSIRVNDQWRIVFRWDGHPPYDVDVVDYP